MEILELYAELLLARAGLLDVRDKERKEGTLGADEGGDSTGLEEAAASIMYAAPRFPREVRELGMVRVLLVERFGKEFAIRAQENRDNIVPERVVKKLKVDPPSEKLVTAYLSEIAKTYGVDWPKMDERMTDLQNEVDEEGSDGEGGGMKEQPILADGHNPTSTPTAKGKVDLGRPFEREELNKATPPRGMAPDGAKSPISVAPPGSRSDNPSPKVKLPGGGEAKPASSSTAKAPQAKDVVGGKVPTVDDLAKRFSALKR